MVYTYTAAPDTSSTATPQGLMDAARLMVGDTDATDPQFQDAEVDWFLAAESTPRLAAHAMALALEGKYARRADKTVGPLKIIYSDQAKAYATLAKTLLERADQDALAQVAPIPVAGQLTDWTTGMGVDADPVTGQPLPGNYFTRQSPRTMASPGQ